MKKIVLIGRVCANESGASFCPVDSQAHEYCMSAVRHKRVSFSKILQEFANGQNVKISMETVDLKEVTRNNNSDN